jgi:hypothetical protein
LGVCQSRCKSGDPDQEMTVISQFRVLIAETQKAREALEAKGAFAEANAATHIILALEALIKANSYDVAVRLDEIHRKHLVDA